MVGSVRLLFLVIFGVTFASATLEVFKHCALPGGSIGKCIYQDECDYYFKKIANKFRGSPTPLHCEGHEKICCRDYPTHTAKQACREYINTLEMAPPVPVVGPQIENGVKVFEKGEFPHMVALGEVSTYTIDFKCGGTLITNKFVLTAAHCDKYNIRYHARLGVNEINNIFNNVSDIPIDRIINHPNYHSVKKINDISLFRLERALVLEPHLIFPACLNTDFEHEETKMIITGWGQTGPDEETSTSLMKAIVTRSSLKYCQERLSKINITESQICAENTTTNADTCPGDSGGPLKISIGNSKYKLYKVIGVTSFGKACATGDPGVYARVSFHLDWIVKTVWED